MDITRNVKKLAHDIADPLVTRLIPMDFKDAQNRNDRLGAIYRAWLHVFTNQIRGGYYEFGVYKGNTFRTAFEVCCTHAHSLNERLTSDEPWKRELAKAYVDWEHAFYAFDTFEGMPDNDEGNLIFAKGTFHGSLEDFRRKNTKVGLEEGDKVRYFKGTFAETASKDAEAIKDLQPAAIANIDCDLYMSTVDALDIVGPKLQQGTVLLMDDWNCFSAHPDKGERRAMREYLAEHNGLEIESWFPYSEAGQAFFVHSTRS